MSDHTPASYFDGLSAAEQRQRRREWNRDPLLDLFPQLPEETLEVILDKCIDKGFTYNLSQGKYTNARRYTSLVIAHARHCHSDYERLLRDEKLERYDARRRTEGQVWKALREWCPWNSSNLVLERCFKATLLRPEERGVDWDPMDIDSDSDDGDFVDDPMDLD